MNTRKCFLMLALSIYMIGAFAIDPAGPTPAPTRGTINLQSISSIVFNKEGVLFMADPLAKRIYALQLEKPVASTTAELNIPNIDEQLAAVLGVGVRDIKIEDMAVQPTSREVFIAVSRRGTSILPTVVKVNANKELSVINLADVSFYETQLNESSPQTLARGYSQTMAITDMMYLDGELFVAGLSGEEFSSKIRRIPYPFTTKTQSVKLEIFHPSHNRFETQSPIETFTSFTLQGKPHLLAAYGCSPLVKFPMDAMSASTELRGTTLAELGGGNRPLDMISFTEGGTDYLLIANSNRTLMQISAEDMVKVNGLEKQTPRIPPYATAGVNYLSIAEIGVMQMDDFNDRSFLVIQRNIEDGSLGLRTIGKLPTSVIRLNARMEALKAEGKFSEMEEEIRKYESIGSKQSVGVQYYNLGCEYALGGKTDNAFNMLNKALAFGYDARNQYETDTDLVSLRNDKRWKDIAARLK